MIQHGSSNAWQLRAAASESKFELPKQPNDPREAARDAAGKLVGSAFIIPYLASIRESSLGAGPFAPNIVERRFGPVIDQQVADAIMQSTNFDLVDAIVDRYPQFRMEQLPDGASGSAGRETRMEWTA